MRLLLLGAGFSRNWGGWLASEVFEWLLGHPAIRKSRELRELLWKTQISGGGFEAALSEVQHAHAADPQKHQATLDDIQQAVSDMFDSMNKAMHVRQFEFSQSRQWQVSTFLGKFDAIFTLNQDTLLEHFYTSDNVQLNDPQRWDGIVFPGLVQRAVIDTAFSDSWAYSEWSPGPSGSTEIPGRYQPIFKLHGSSNWTSASGSPLLIVGGAKSKAIADTPVLQAYMSEFQRLLTLDNARLMTIGYGYRDDHINEVIVDAARKGLLLYNISPQGSDAAKVSNGGRQGIVQPANNPLEEAFEQNLIGASRRSLSAIFSDDVVEHRKILRFFD